MLPVLKLDIGLPVHENGALRAVIEFPTERLVGGQKLSRLSRAVGGIRIGCGKPGLLDRACVGHRGWEWFGRCLRRRGGQILVNRHNVGVVLPNPPQGRRDGRENSSRSQFLIISQARGVSQDGGVRISVHARQHVLVVRNPAARALGWIERIRDIHVGISIGAVEGLKQPLGGAWRGSLRIGIETAFPLGDCQTHIRIDALSLRLSYDDGFHGGVLRIAAGFHRAGIPVRRLRGERRTCADWRGRHSERRRRVGRGRSSWRDRVGIFVSGQRDDAVLPPPQSEEPRLLRLPILQVRIGGA